MNKKNNILVNLINERQQHHILFSDQDSSELIEGVKNLEIRFFDFFSVDEARSFISEFYLATEEHKNIVIFIREINIQAQNALLKLLESNGGKKLFIFIFPVTLYILETVKSRCKVTYNINTINSNIAKKYISYNSLERMKMTNEVYDIEKNNVSNISLLNSFECYFEELLHSTKTIDKSLFNMYKEISLIREHIKDNMCGKHIFYTLAFM